MKSSHQLHVPASQNAPWLQMSGARITDETPFSQAADLWLGAFSVTEDIGLCTIRKIRKTTEVGYRADTRTLKLFFGNIRLCDIRLDHIAKYEALRSAGTEPFNRKRRPNKNVEPAPCPAGPPKINKEISLLKRILRIAKVWGEEQELLHKPLVEEESDVQRALARDEQTTWLRVALSSARWHWVYYYSLLAFATCMSTNELRSLRIGDIYLDAGFITIPGAGSKNKYRHRPVRIGTEGDEAYHAVKWLLSRAASLGSAAQHHYLFPFREPGGQIDPTRPMSNSGIKKTWGEVRLASKLKFFRPYDTRHTAITRLAEQGTPMIIIMGMAGHISERMTRHYTHISEQLKLDAMRQVQATRHLAQPQPVRVSKPVGLISLGAQALPAPKPFGGSTAGFFISSGSTFFVNSSAKPVDG